MLAAGSRPESGIAIRVPSDDPGRGKNRFGRIKHLVEKNWENLWRRIEGRMEFQIVYLQR
jgi:hypothetical protein